MDIIYEPVNWIDLQNKVAIILSRCGYNVQTPKILSGPRGNVEVDVYAKKDQLTIICECKYWNRAIPQSIVHGFRTIINDLGANVGLIIAKSGFQAGAIKSSLFTNVSLLDWGKFQNRFEQDFLNGYAQYIEKYRLQLYKYSSYLKTDYDKYYDKLTKQQKRDVDARRGFYEVIALKTNPLIVSKLSLMNPFDVDKNFLIQYMLEMEKFFNTKFDTYDKYYSTIFNFINDGIQFFNDIYNIDSGDDSLY